MRAVKAGSIQEAVQTSYVAAGGIAEVSAMVGVAPSSLSYGTEIREDRPGGIGVNYLDRLGRMDTAAARPIAEHFCALAGGFFQPFDAEHEDLADHCQTLAKEGGEALAATIRAATSGTLPDCEEALRELDDGIEAQTNARAALMTKIEGLRRGQVR